MNVTEGKPEEIDNVEDNPPPALARWLWFTLIVLSAGLGLVAGRVIMNFLVIKVMKKTQNKADDEENAKQKGCCIIVGVGVVLLSVKKPSKKGEVNHV